MKQKAAFTTLLLLSVSIWLTSCSEDGERLDIYATQECVNKANESDKAQLQACLSKLGGASSPEAKALECSINLMIGGITTTAVVNAYKAQENSSQGSAALMLTFAYSLDGNVQSDSAEIQAAADTVKICQDSGQKGLIGIASFVQVGTGICSLGGLCDGDIDDADVDALLGQCSQPSGSGGCSVEAKEAIGAAAITLANEYCTGSNQGSDECNEVEQAIAAAGGTGNPQAIADALLNALNNP